MSVTLTADFSDVDSIALRIAAGIAKIPVTEGESTVLCVGDDKYTGSSAERGIARIAGLSGSNALSATEVDHWVAAASRMRPLNENALTASLSALDGVLKLRTFLVGDGATYADIAVYSAVVASDPYSRLSEETKSSCVHFSRWLATCDSIPSFGQVAAAFKSGSANTKTKAATGKFFNLKDAKVGEVVLRFPPEASGFMHVGHAKAVLISQYLTKEYQGKMILRFDDTNPAKESEEFEHAILEDLKLLGVKWDMFTRTSDHFDYLMEMCEKLIKEKKAYVDDTPHEQMTALRMKMKTSACRTRSTEENLSLWEEMKTGSEKGKSCVVRSIMLPQSTNGALRDPPIYRCKPEPHVRYGDKYKVYPLYDFACPLVDSREGVTHALRTTEYRDRNEQYRLIAADCGVRCPVVEDFSRLGLEYTCLAKRQLRYFVAQKVVDGWSDPRFPTVRGILRRGMTVQALRDFILEIGSSKSNAVMAQDKLWAKNKQVIDPWAPRHTALAAVGQKQKFEADSHIGLVLLEIAGQKTEAKEIQFHPKEPRVGMKKMHLANKVWVQLSDAQLLEEGQKITLMDYGNAFVTSITRDCGLVRSVKVKSAVGDTDYKGTQKLTFIAACDEEAVVPVVCVEYGHLINTKEPPSVSDGTPAIEAVMNVNSKKEFTMVGAASLSKLHRGDIIQLNKLGFWVCDDEYNPQLNRPVRLVGIPDGKQAKDHSVLEQACMVTITDDMFAQADKEAKIQAEKHLTIKKGKADQDTKKQAMENSSNAAALVSLMNLFRESGSETNPVTDTVKTSTTSAPVATKASVGGGDAAGILQQHDAQGLVVRDLKKGGDKAAIKAAVAVLVGLKKQYKELTGEDVPKGGAPVAAKPVATKAASTASGFDLAKQKVRELKQTNASEAEVKAAITACVSAAGQVIIDLKKAGASVADVKVSVDTYLAIAKSAGVQVDSQVEAPAPAVVSGGGDDDAAATTLLAKCEAQGVVVRDLKPTKSTDPEGFKAALDSLLALKKEYKDLTGKDVPAAPSSRSSKPKKETKEVVADSGPVLTDPAAIALLDKINAQGITVRDLKKSKQDAAEAVDTLKALKTDFKAMTGFEVVGGKASLPKVAAPKKKKAAQKEKAKKESKQTEGTKLGISVGKEEDFSVWYIDTIKKSEMIEYYDVSGCFILRPAAYCIWEAIMGWFDKEIKKLDVENCYFPIFVPKKYLEKEKDHIADFAPEVAWVTKSGDTELAIPIAIRPTSETAIYPAYSDWIQSHRDLPMKLNQWCNVVRWEFKHAQPFLRTREFLWQEGHTAYQHKKEAEVEVLQILELYAKVYQDLLAVPVIKGRKTEKEKFAGGDYTTTVEAFIGTSGRSIQGATSHHLGQNFSKMFEIDFEDPDSPGNKKFVYQNSWGITTRTIGVMVMVHGDDKGLVIPPRVSQHQIVLIPTGLAGADAPVEQLHAKIQEFHCKFIDAGIRSKKDIRDSYTPPWKYSHYELRGVPIRLELGPKDLKSNTVMLVRRDTNEKTSVPEANLVEHIKNLLDTIQSDLFNKAKKNQDDHVVSIDTWDKFVPTLNNKNLLLVPFCGVPECEGNIKKDSARAFEVEGEEVDENAPSMGAKSLCIPFDHQGGLKPGMKCIHPACKSDATCITLFGRSY
eukprot:m.196091 g.196091  ORF g.196091 m.196091 type:complete len:1633 (+) comp32603_c0_seq2:108-5006(+)